MSMDYYNKVIKFDPVNHYIIFTVEDLVKLKQNLSTNDINILKEKLEDSINIDYEKEKKSIIFKKKPIEGISLNDYISLATYHWPNPNTSDNLPYIQKDGYSNPEGELYDKDNLRLLAYITYMSSLLYYLTEEKKYLDLVVKNCTYFFIDEKTKMNPNMNHAQMIRGVNMGRGIGIIDYAANFTYALTMLKNLKDLNFMDMNFYNSMKSWCNEFLIWLKYSKNGSEERHSRNNHGSMYDLLLIVLYDLLEMPSEIVPLAFDFVNHRIIPQITASGEMPLETKRTKSMSYSLMGFKAFYDFSIISKKYGFNMWDINSWYYKKIDVNLKSTLDYLYNYLVLKNQTWPFEQVTIFDTATLLPIIYEATKVFGESYNKLNLVDLNELVHDIIYILINKLI